MAKALKTSTKKSGMKSRSRARTKKISKPLTPSLYDAIRSPRATAASLATGVSSGRWIPFPYLIKINRQLTYIERNKINRLLIMMPPRHGKALADDTPILTTKGWKLHGKLHPGDRVFAPNGSQVRVLAVSKPIANDCWRIRFSDGREIVASGRHDWMVEIDRDCKRQKCNRPRGHRHQQNRETNCIMSGYHRRRPRIRLAKSPKIISKTFLIDPYLLGAWLGDGSSSMGYLFCGSQDIHHFSALGEVTDLDKGRYRILVRGMKKNLCGLGLLQNKHIPEQYYRGSVKQRRALLQGLMDTDGYIAKNGQAEYLSVKKRLAEDVRALIESLGMKATLIIGKATIHGKDCGVKYRILFTPSAKERVFRLKRKQARVHERIREEVKYRYIISVEPTASVSMRCIQVEGGQYVAGRGLIATCNSELVSKWFTAWFLGENPSKRVILTSYEADFAAEWGRKSRDILEDIGPGLFSIKVRSESHAASRWDIEGYDGGMRTAGARGPITGKGADLFVIDDPIKNDAEANSKTYRDSTWDWFTGTVYDRLEPNGAIVIIMTRWHEDDLAGRIMERMEEDWTVMRLPAIAEDNDLAERSPGEALCPERYTVEDLDRIKTAVGAHWWSSKYQQRPAPAEGSIFRRQWFRYWKRHGERILRRPGDDLHLDRLFRFGTVDLALSKKETADYTVLCVWAFDHEKGDLFLLDRIRERMEAPDINPMINATIQRHKLAFAAVEATAFQMSIIQDARRRGIAVREFIPDKDKVSRAQAATPIMEAGHFWLPENAEWLSDFESELLNFPKSEHDDQVDNVSMAAHVVRESPGASQPPPSPLKEGARSRRFSMDGYSLAEPDWSEF